MQLDEDIIRKTIEDYLEVEVVSNGNSPYLLTFRVLGLRGYDSLSETFTRLYKSLSKQGYVAMIKRDYGELTLNVSKRESKTKKGMAIGLAVTTLVMVYVSGFAFAKAQSFLSLEPLLYLVGLIVPLIIHEMGHWITMKKYGIPASLPYLIPAPPLQLGFLGTFGAVINMEWIPPNNDVLALTGIMGPLFGFIATIPVAAIGLKLSSLVPIASVPPGSSINLIPIVLNLLTYIEKIPSGYAIQPSAMMFASYIVFFITFLNLIPISQLDGGHVIRAALGEKAHYIVSGLFVAILIIYGFYYPVFILFGLLALFIFLLTKGKHPGTATNGNRLGRKGLLAIILYCVLLILTLPLPS
ncbi:MAG: site-2 protease family protein [Caldisphaeraceae archaeon]|nr:site-2 protease family protein [Caldisphaeraceae archaeon]